MRTWASRNALLIVATLCLVTACAPPPSASSSSRPSTIMVGARPGVPAIGAGAVWVPNTGDGTVSRIDPRTDRVVATITIGNAFAFFKQSCEAYGSVHSFMVTTFDVRNCDLPGAVATTSNAVWALGNDTQELVRIDPASNRIVARIPLGVPPFDLAADDRGVWVTSFFTDTVVRVDPATNTVVQRLTGLSHEPAGVTLAGNAVWVTSTFGAAVTRIDAATGMVAAVIPIACPGICLAGPRPLPVLAAASVVWVRNEGNNTLSRIDPQRNTVVDTVAIDAFYGRDGLDSMATTSDRLWLGGVSLQERSAITGSLIRRRDVSATAVASDGSTLWYTDIAGRVHWMSVSTGE